MAKLFDIVDTDIVLDPRVIAIPALKAVWDKDKSKGKERAKKELTYVVFMADFHSPYRDLPDANKEETIRKDIFKGEDWVPLSYVHEAVEKYTELQETRHSRMLKALRHTEEEITYYFKSISLKDTDDFGKPKHNINEIVKNMKEVGGVIKSISMLEKQVESELLEGKVQGESEIGPYER
jgi:hypothetical protein